MTEAFVTIHAAELAHVAPWELEQQSVFWRNHIIEKANIEADAAKERQRRATANARIAQSRRR